MADNSDLVVDAAPDLDDDIAPAVDAVEPAKAKADPPPDLDPVADDDDALEAVLAKAEKEAEATDAGKPAKDPATGRFVSKTGEQPQTEATQPTGEVRPADGQAPDRFAHWPAEHRAAYDKLPPEARTVVDAHERLILDGVRQQVMPALEDAEPFMAVLSEPSVQSYLQRVSTEEQIPAQQVVKRLINFENKLRYGTHAEKVALLQQMSVDYRIPLPSNLTPADDDGAPLDPRVHAALHDMGQKLAAREWELQQLAQSQQGQTRAQIQQEVTQFATARDDQGNPKYPLYEAVRGTMANLIDAGKARTMDEAYRIAAKPVEDEIAKRTRSTAEKQRERAAEAVKRAERTRPIRGSMGPMTASDADLDTIISNALDAAA